MRSWEDIGRITVPYAYRTHDFGIKLAWDVGQKSQVTVGWHRKKFEREHREITDSDEDAFKVSCDTRQIDKVTLRASYEHGDRSISEYSTEAQELSFTHPEGINNQPGLRKFDEAARKYDTGRVSAQIAASD